MAVTRLDTFTSTGKKTVYYSDFTDNFDKELFGDDLLAVTNEKSVNQSLKNLIYTNVNERPFQPLVGSSIRKMLFEPNTPSDLNALKNFIFTTITNFEPRVNLVDVTVTSEVDSETITATITYTLINTQAPITLTLFLNRVR